MRSGSGTKFTIDRKLFSSDIWFASPWKLKIWLYLVGNANHKDGEFMGIQLKRGQLIRSYRTIQKDCSYKIGYRIKKPSLSTISTICEDLTKERRIELRKEQSGQIITILNYNELQPLKNNEANDEANATRTQPEQNKNVKNVLTTPLTPQKAKNAYSETFEAWWKIYPKKIGKDAAFKSWKKALNQPKTISADLINAINNQIEADHFAGRNGEKFIPLPTTWLNQGRWKDEVNSPEQSTGSPYPRLA